MQQLEIIMVTGEGESWLMATEEAGTERKEPEVRMKTNSFAISRQMD